MRKIVLLIIISIINYFNCFGQKENKILDEKNGFKDFKIGDNYSKWQNQIKQVSSNDEGTYYEYTGNCCNKIFNVELQKIVLFFVDNKLDIIWLYTQPKYSDTLISTGPDYFNLMTNFETLFKQKTNTVVGDNPGDFECGWYGTNIILSLTAVNMGLQKDQESGKFLERYRCLITVANKKSIESGF